MELLHKREKKIVCKVKKSLYALKQVLRQWHKKFELIMEKRWYKKINSDYCVFVQKFSMDNFIML